MKKLLLVLVIGSFVACNNGDTEVNVTDSSAADTTVVVAPDTTVVVAPDTTVLVDSTKK